VNKKAEDYVKNTNTDNNNDQNNENERVESKWSLK